MKLLISDLDGTLYPRNDIDNPNQLQANFDAVKKWIEAGNKFAVATARGLHHYDVLVEKLGFSVNFVGGNGATVKLESGEIIIKEFSSCVYLDLCRYIKEHKINASLATGLNNKWTWSSKENYPRGISSYDSIWDSVELAKLDEIDPTIGISRIQVFTPSENRDILKQLIIEQQYPVTITTSDVDLIDIGPLQCSKGISILELCNKFSIDKDNLIVVGDSENDIPMFETTQHSYCIDTAESLVKEKANKTVKSVEELIRLELN